MSRLVALALLLSPAVAWSQEADAPPAEESSETSTSAESSGDEAADEAADEAPDEAPDEAAPVEAAPVEAAPDEAAPDTDADPGGAPLAVPVTQPKEPPAATSSQPSSATPQSGAPEGLEGGVVGGVSGSRSFDDSVAVADEPVPDSSRPSLKLPDDWDYEPYWRPVGGMSGFGGSGGAWVLTLGAQAGARAWDRGSPLQVHTRARGVTYLGSGAIGSDLRVGVFAGPGWDMLNIWVGPDVWRNTFRISNYPYAYVLEPTLGVDLSAMATIGPQDFYAVIGATPALVLNPDRRVNWAEIDAIGFGHEFEWVIGVISNTGPLRVGLLYSRRIVANGVQQGWGVSAGI